MQEHPGVDIKCRTAPPGATEDMLQKILDSLLKCYSWHVYPVETQGAVPGAAIEMRSMPAAGRVSPLHDSWSAPRWWQTLRLL